MATDHHQNFKKLPQIPRRMLANQLCSSHQITCLASNHHLSFIDAMRIFKKQHSCASRRRRLVVLLMFGFAAVLLAVNAQETTAASDSAAGTAAQDVPSSEPFEDYIDLDDTGLAAKESDHSTKVHQSKEKETVSEDNMTEAVVGSPEIEQEEDEIYDNIVQKGPLVDLLGPTLLSLVLTGENTARFEQNLTNDALAGKTVVGLYFSAGAYNTITCLLFS
jgi:hypothetical protein